MLSWDGSFGGMLLRGVGMAIEISDGSLVYYDMAHWGDVIFHWEDLMSHWEDIMAHFSEMTH
jgi:hypothetical protein